MESAQLLASDAVFQGNSSQRSFSCVWWSAANREKLPPPDRATESISRQDAKMPSRAMTENEIRTVVVEGKVILELKSVERVTVSHRKQIQTYLRLTGCKLGYLLNFGQTLMKNGITRAVNGMEDV
jgi:hypothetical protein